MTCVVDVEQAVASSTGQLLSVNLGQARPLMAGGRKILSAIGKQAVEGSVAVNRLGLDGDKQVELSIHGGIDKAVYAYPVEHHAFWQKQRQTHGVSLFDEAFAAKWAKHAR